MHSERPQLVQLARPRILWPPGQQHTGDVRVVPVAYQHILYVRYITVVIEFVPARINIFAGCPATKGGDFRRLPVLKFLIFQPVAPVNPRLNARIILSLAAYSGYTTVGINATGPVTAPRPPRVRSAVTNGRRLFVEGDGNTAWSRRYRDLIAGHVGDLGGQANLSESTDEPSATGFRH